MLINREPGPLDLVDASALQSLPTRGSFVGLTADHLGAVPGLDAQLVTSRGTLVDIAVDAYDGLDGVLSDALADGLDVPGADVPSAGATDIARGDNVDLTRQAVQEFLPPVDTPIDMTFDEPPAPPHVSPVPTQEQKDPANPEVLIP